MMSIDYLNESIFHMIHVLSFDEQKNHENKYIHIIEKLKKILFSQKNYIHNLKNILENIQYKIIQKEIENTNLKNNLEDKIKLTNILIKKINENDISKDTNFINDNNFLCIACCEKYKDNVFLPCYHCCYCDNCIKKTDIKQCPICRENISNIKKIFFN